MNCRSFAGLIVTSLLLAISSGCVSTGMSERLIDIDERVSALEEQSAQNDSVVDGLAGRTSVLEGTLSKLDLRSIHHGCTLALLPDPDNESAPSYSHWCE